MTENAYHVRWLDSGLSYTDGWKSFDEIARTVRLANVDTIGVKFYETEDTIYMALSVHGNDAYGVQAIAKSNIIFMKELVANGEEYEGCE